MAKLIGGPMDGEIQPSPILGMRGTLTATAPDKQLERGKPAAFYRWNGKVYVFARIVGPDVDWEALVFGEAVIRVVE